MNRILISGLIGTLLVAACTPAPVSQVKSYTYRLPSNPAEGSDLTLLMAGGTLDIAPSASPETILYIQTNRADWVPIAHTDAGATTLEQPNRPPSTWQRVPEVINDWRLAAGSEPLDLKIDARMWEGSLDFTGVDLHSFQLADAGSQGVIRFGRPSGLVSRFVIDSARSNLQVYGLLNTGAEEAAITGAAGHYLLDFSGDLQRDMQVEVTTGLGVMRVEIDAAVNARITYRGMTRKTTIQGKWISEDGAYIHPNPGYLLDLAINSDQGDLEVVLVEET